MPLLKHCLAILAILSMAACEYIPFSGGELHGTVTATPADWSSVAHESIVQLETNPADPYSVKLWVIDMGPALYIHAGPTGQPGWSI